MRTHGQKKPEWLRLPENRTNGLRERMPSFYLSKRIYRHPAALALVLTILPVSAALCSTAASKGSPSEALLLLQIVLLILTGRLLGEFLERIGFPAVMGMLLSGILLGPSVFGLLWARGQGAVFPDMPEQRAMLDAVSQVGILLLLLLSGMETDLSLLRKVKRSAVSASLAGIVIPFGAGFLLGQILPESMLPGAKNRLITSLFLGTALSISSVKIVATVVRQMGFVRRNIGQIILASAIVDDTIGWIIIAITFGLAEQGAINGWILARSGLGTLLFLAMAFTLGRRLVFKIIRLTNDHFVSEAAVPAAILVVMGAMALVTHWLGVHTVLGAFVAGILVGQSPILTKEIDEQIRGITAGLFMPVFFGAAGLHTDLTVLRDFRLLLLTGGMLAIATFGKAAGALLGGWLGGLNRREAVALAAGMNARGSTEVIVGTIGLSMGVLNENLFTMIVTTAFITTLLMPPTLRWALGRLPLEGDENKRLERESFEKKGFVPNLERVLLMVDQSSSGKLATRLAGLLAGRRNMPVTVLSLAQTEDLRPPRDEEHSALEGARDAVHRAAQPTDPAEGSQEKGRPEVEVTVQIHDVPPAEAVKTEAAKGYDLLMIGMEPATAPQGGFNQRLSRIVMGFEGALAIVVARGTFQNNPMDQPFNILAPLTGSGSSGRSAEVALALAQAASAPLTALSLAAAVAKSASEGRNARREDDQILREIGRLGKYFDVEVRREVGKGPIQQAIRKSADNRQPCIIVFGASRRPGEQLSLGPVAAGLLAESKHSLLIIST
jgi:Kef-type K+ transport system membrane component KefB/nucleotide-binding universal stress UspA family protein